MHPSGRWSPRISQKTLKAHNTPPIQGSTSTNGTDSSTQRKPKPSLLGADWRPPAQSGPRPAAGSRTKVAWTRALSSASLVERATALSNRWSPWFLQWQDSRTLLDRHGDAVADPEPVGAAPPYPAPAAPAALAPLSEISATATVSMNHSEGVFVSGAALPSEHYERLALEMLAVQSGNFVEVKDAMRTIIASAPEGADVASMLSRALAHAADRALN